MGSVIRSFVLALGFCLPILVAADAATPPPAGMTQQQYDELVKAVGQSVLQTLTEKGVVTAPSAPSSSVKPAQVNEEEQLAEGIRNTVDAIPTVLGGYSYVWAELSLLPEQLDQRSAGGRGLWTYLGLLALITGGAFLVEVGVGRLTRAKRNVIIQQITATGGLWRVAALALLDALAVVALWLVVQFALGTLFARAGFQTHFAAIILRGLVTWRMFLLLFRLYLRPELPIARLAPVSDESARRLLQLLGFSVLVGIVGRAWIGLLTSPAAISAAILTNGVVELTIFIVVLFALRRDMSSWLLGLISDDGRNKGGIKLRSPSTGIGSPCRS